jgi:hypothetical protein
MNTDNTANNIPVEYSNLTLTDMLKKCEEQLIQLQDLADQVSELHLKIQKYLHEEEN